VKESLTSRVGRIVSGSLNALIDAVESAVPEAVMEEAIREIDSAIDEVRTELGRLVANKHLASKRLTEENGKHEDLAQKIELALSENREDLAEAAIAQQIDIEAQLPVLEATISECGTQEKELEGYVAALLAKKREMQEELKLFRQTQAAAAATTPNQSNVKGGSQVEMRVDKASSAFDRVVEKASGVLGSGTPTDKEAAIRLAELDELARKKSIKERLEAAKQKSISHV